MLLCSDNQSISVHVSAMAVLCFGACLIVKFDVFHPYCWFSVFFFLYADAYAILYAANYSTRAWGYNKQPIFLHWIALVVFLFVVTPRSYRIFTEKLSGQGYLEFPHSKLVNIGITILGVWYLLATMSAIAVGAAGKIQLYSMNIWIVNMVVLITRLMYIFFICQYCAVSSVKKRPAYMIIFRAAVPVCILGLFLGERDLYFGFIVIIIITSYFLGFIKKKHFLFFAPLSVAALLLSVIYKSFFIRSHIHELDISSNNVFLAFLDGEFMSAGRNLQIVTSSTATKGMFKGYGLIGEILRTFNIKAPWPAPNLWFNSTYFPTVTRTGYGFTLVGTGYVNFGIFGVVLIYIFVALSIRYLYKYSFQNRYVFLLYMTAIPVYVYATRQSLVNILSPMILHSGLSVLLVYLCSKIEMKRLT
jgi:hypothetical protein